MAFNNGHLGRNPDMHVHIPTNPALTNLDNFDSVDRRDITRQLIDRINRGLLNCSIQNIMHGAFNDQNPVN